MSDSLSGHLYLFSSLGGILRYKMHDDGVFSCDSVEEAMEAIEFQLREQNEGKHFFDARLFGSEIVFIVDKRKIPRRSAAASFFRDPNAFARQTEASFSIRRVSGKDGMSCRGFTTPPVFPDWDWDENNEQPMLTE